MDVKTLFGLTVIPGAILCGMIAATLSKSVRDVFVGLLVFTCPLVERMDVNYVSREWYRGTSRGFEVAVLDVLAISILAGCLLAPREGHRRFYWPASLGLILLFVLYSSFNVALADPKLFGMFELWRMIRGLVVVLALALYVQSERDLKVVLLGIVLFLAFQALLAIKQRYLDGYHRVPGTLVEPNSLSVLFCTAAPVLIAMTMSRLPKWLKLMAAVAIPLVLVAEILTISRAGVVILGAVLFASAFCMMRFRITARGVVIVCVALLGVTAMIAKSWKTLGERFHSASLKEEYDNKRNMGRGYYIRLAKLIASDEIFGVGLNNWSYWVSNKYGPRLGYRFVPYRGTEYIPSEIVPPTSNVEMAQAAPAHSLGALTLGELGIPGFLIFAVLWLRWFQMGASFLWPRDADPMRRIAVGILFGFCGMFLQNITEWVFRHMPLYYTFHVMLGTLMGLYFVKRQAARKAKEERRLREQDEQFGLAENGLSPVPAT